MTTRLFWVCAFSIFYCFPSFSTAELVPAQVMKVIDGDTIRVKTEDGSINRVRIRGIDAPETDQQYGYLATKALSRVLERGDWVTLDTDKRDRYGRLLASVDINGYDVGLMMIEGGYAWFYRYYSNNLPMELSQQYSDAERAAWEQKRGLWQGRMPIEPWKFRRSH